MNFMEQFKAVKEEPKTIIECAFEIAKRDLVLPEKIANKFIAYYDKKDGKVKIKFKN
jgi:hypothetical protein